MYIYVSIPGVPVSFLGAYAVFFFYTFLPVLRFVDRFFCKSSLGVRSRSAGPKFFDDNRVCFFGPGGSVPLKKHIGDVVRSFVVFCCVFSP